MRAVERYLTTCDTMVSVMSKHVFGILISVALVWLSACVAAQPLPLPADVVMTAERGPQQMIAFLYRDAQGARLVNSLSVARDPPVPLDPPDQQVWLGALPLPADLNLVDVSGVQYGMVIAQGDWQAEGQYGPDGAWPRALASPRLRPFTPETVDLATLLRGNHYEGQVVRVRAVLLISSGASLLVEEVGSGGVPTARARQIKLLFSERDQEALARLQSSGSVRFGQVEVIARWQQGRLETLMLIPWP